MITRIAEKIAAIVAKQIKVPAKPTDETALLAIGKILSNNQHSIESKNIQDYEFKIFSQFGDDGIIQYLIKNIYIENEIFIEFGVEDFMESNSRFLMMNNNWSGFVMDGSAEALSSLEKRDWFWKYDLSYKAVFITKENINGLLQGTGFKNIGLLHIDIDGNDYHIFETIDVTLLNPSIIIIEYNSVFGKERAITIPYKENFNRTESHYSNLYMGASLSALQFIANKKGYALVVCNSAGNNAYFVRKDLLNEKVKETSIGEAFKESKFRESRNRDQTLSYIGRSERLAMIKDLDVINVITNTLEKL